jgi:hypothetical protein
MRNTKRPYFDRFMAMTDAQRDAEVAVFDKEDLSPGKPLSPRERRTFDRIVKRGRPPVGQGAEKIRISLERGLLKQTDKLARTLRLSRSQLIATGLRRMLQNP